MKTLVLAAMLLCATALVAGPLMARPGDLEPLHLFKIASGVMSVGVATSGYTTKDNFKVEVRTEEKARTCTVRVVRIKADEGKMMPQPLLITYRLVDLKIDPYYEVRLENPFCDRDD